MGIEAGGRTLQSLVYGGTINSLYRLRQGVGFPVHQKLDEVGGDALHVFQPAQELLLADITKAVVSNLETYTVVGYRAINHIVIVHIGRDFRLVAMLIDEICPILGVCIERPEGDRSVGEQSLIESELIHRLL